MMKQIDIIGENYFGQWSKSRTACRAVVVRDGKILLSYETQTGQWMIPGGGLENGEDERECCIREAAEETGVLVRPSLCFLEIDEYYEDCKYITLYYSCEILGETARRLTEREKEVGMEPRWLPVGQIREIFHTYPDFTDTDEMRRGLYQREYTALCEWERLNS